MSKYVLTLSSLETTIARTGGKGANLAVLTRLGFNVPPAFIITTEAYRTFIEANHIQAVILSRAKHITSEVLDPLETISTEIRDRFEQGGIPEDIAAQVKAAYRELSEERHKLPVAVRSSATTEDLPGMAFAGQQDTFLNVMGADALLVAVKKCWGSLWTARALAYRAHNQIPPDEVALAVVVQRMIASESSGVLFTANPVTGRRDEIVIDASFGLGEAIVSGQVDPDHYVVDPHRWQITECKLGTKEIVIRPHADGGTEQVQPRDAHAQALPDAQVLELAQISQRVAEQLGAPQDIEWAWANGKLYLLQSRPITSLYPLPENARSSEGVRVYVNFNAIQGVKDPLTSLGRDALRLVFSDVRPLLRLHSSMRELLPDAGDRLFMDLTDLVRDGRLQNFALTFVAQSDSAARQTLQRLIDDRRIPPKRVLTLRRALTLFLALLPILRRVLTAMVSPEQVRPRVFAGAEHDMAKTRAHVQAAQHFGALLDAMQNDLPRAEDIGLNVMPTVLPAFAAIPILDRWLSEWLGEPHGAARQLMRGLSSNVTTDMNLKLWAVAQTIRTDPDSLREMRSQSLETLVEKYHRGTLPTIAQLALDEFLKEYGMRAVAEIDLGRPRWREDPTPILQTLLGYLQIEDPNAAPDEVYRRNQEQAERLATEYITRARKTRWGWLRARLIGGVIRRIRALSGLRELPLFYMVKTLDIYRSALLDRARELVTRGELDVADDIFFVPLHTLKLFGEGEKTDLKAIVAANRANYAHECARKQMPRVLLSTGEAFYEGVSDPTATENDLVGEAVSPGSVEGRVHVILDPRGARLEPGEILVCPSTDPGWTPLFLTAGGLVMEIGGMITHGSVVAREYGIPAVVGVHNATTRLKTGQRVRVDGNRGRVMVLE